MTAILGVEVDPIVRLRQAILHALLVGPAIVIGNREAVIVERWLNPTHVVPSVSVDEIVIARPLFAFVFLRVEDALQELNAAASHVEEHDVLRRPYGLTGPPRGLLHLAVLFLCKLFGLVYEHVHILAAHEFSLYFFQRLGVPKEQLAFVGSGKRKLFVADFVVLLELGVFAEKLVDVVALELIEYAPHNDSPSARMLKPPRQHDAPERSRLPTPARATVADP